MLGYWDAPFEQDWGLDWHCNEGIEIGYLATGSLPFSVGKRSYQVRPGSLTITRPWQRHRVGTPNVPASHYSWLILDVGVRRPNQPWSWPDWLLCPQSGLKRLTNILRQNEQPVWQSDPHIRSCFARLDEAVRLGASKANCTRIKILINDLVVLLAEMMECRRPCLDKTLPSSERTVRLFLESLHARMDEPWTLDSMADACGLGRTHFAGYCRKLVNMSPVEYLTRCRLDASARMLTEKSSKSVTEIAFGCGFQSSQYFARVFRKHFGFAPSEFSRRRG